jgi:hypothetical protein
MHQIFVGKVLVKFCPCFQLSAVYLPFIKWKIFMSFLFCCEENFVTLKINRFFDVESFVKIFIIEINGKKTEEKPLFFQDSKKPRVGNCLN